MSSPDRQKETELLSQALDLLECEGLSALEDFLQDCPNEAESIRRRLRILVESGLPIAFDDPEPVPSELGDFLLLEAIGSGGMGVVWRARQKSLDRDVALKLIRPDQLLFPGTRDRFRHEVETVAQLQHPGIAPVFAVGEDRGLNYYAMELVRGLSLEEILDSLRGNDPATLRGQDVLDLLPSDPKTSVDTAFFDSSWSDLVLRIVREVAETLEYARRRGVVHRDVKPSNVMITREGRVLLLDFGLSASDGSKRITRPGSAVGSLAYLAPERLPGAPLEHAAGTSDDPRLDVYSLGVTLFELLALELPYTKTESLGLIAAAQEGSIKPLRSLNRAAPSDVATLLSIAMEHTPSRRYGTAGLLSRDIDNVLAQRPLEAQRPGKMVRARRWVQRNPILATLYLAAVLVPSALFLQEARSRTLLEEKNEEIGNQAGQLERQAGELTHANSGLRSALGTAEKERERAEEALEKAMDAVDRMMVRVGEDFLIEVPGMEIARRQLLEEALAFQVWFLAKAKNTPSLQARAAGVALGAAKVQGWLDDLDAAGESLNLGEQLLAKAEFEDPLLAAEIHLTRARIEGLRGNNTEARSASDRALALLEKKAPEGLRRTILTSRILIDRSESRAIDGDLDAAEGLLRESIEMLELYSSDDTLTESNRLAVFSELARAYVTLARVLDHRVQQTPGAARGEFDQALVARALKASEHAVDSAEELLELRPQLAGNQQRAGRAYAALGLQLYRSGKIEESALVIERAVQQFEELTAQYPSVATYFSDLGMALNNLSSANSVLGNDELMREQFGRSSEAFREYFEKGGRDLNVRSSYTALLYNQGVLLEGTADWEQALKSYDRCGKAVDDFLREAPEHPQAKLVAANLLENGLPTYSLHGEPEQLVVQFRRYLQRTHNEAERLEILGKLAGWLEAAAEFDEFDDDDRERIADSVFQVADELIHLGLEEGSLSVDRLRQDPALEPLRFYGPIRSSLGLE